VNPDSTERPAGPLRQLLGSFSGLLATVVGIGRTRLELFTVEVREELRRVADVLLWGAVAVLAAAGGVFFAGLGIIFIFWDTHRILAVGLVTAAYFVIAGLAALNIRSMLRERPSFLQATLGELARDEAELRDRVP
jgi:uncharacterized membrane protein YqjE